MLNCDSFGNIYIFCQYCRYLNFLCSRPLTLAIFTQGGLPSEVGLLSELEVLILSKNNLAGTLPSELGNLVNLAVLYLQDNLLEGKIPPELGNITSIEFMNLTNNVLTGEVPDDLCSDGATIQADCSVSCAVDCCANYEC